MNAKLCKKLRKIARSLAQDNGYTQRELVEGQKHRTLINSGFDEIGNPQYSTFEYTGTDKNNPKTERGIYRVLKANSKKD